MKVQIYTIETDWVREFGGDLTVTLENPYDYPKIYPMSQLDYVQAYEPVELPDGYTVEECKALGGTLFICDDHGTPCALTTDHKGERLTMTTSHGIKTIPLHAILDPKKSPDFMPQLIRAIK